MLRCTETRERPKLLADLSPETAKLIEDVKIDSKGRAVPKLYSKLIPPASRTLSHSWQEADFLMPSINVFGSVLI